MQFIKEIRYSIGLCLVILSIMAFKSVAENHKMENIKKDNPSKNFAVIELFTSEGCWSCPPADELIAKLSKDNKNKKLYILAYHVDYWDHQGWKDKFSQHSFTLRQRAYASNMNLSTIYTPQIVINGQTEVVGSDTNGVLSAIQDAMASDHLSTLTLTIDELEGKQIKVHYTSQSKAKKSTLHIALVQKEAITYVKAGENAGKTLSHVQIVRDLQYRNRKTNDSFSFTLPDKENKWEIIAFEQDKTTGQILDATSINL